MTISQNGLSPITINKQIDNHLNRHIINASTHQRIRKDQDKLNKMKQNPQYNNMQQWGIQLSLERIIEIDSKLINLTKLLNYITEKQKEQE